MPWIAILVGIGAVLPIVVAVITVWWRSSGVPGSGSIIRATVIGVALGAAGGLLVSALVIGLTLGLRELR
jgi:hypothetical protein